MRLTPIKHIKIKKDIKVKDLAKQFSNAGFGARKLGLSCEIFKSMTGDKDCRVFFGLAGAMIPAGMRNIIADMLKDNLIDVFVTTGANITHDIIESLGHRHYVGTENANDSLLNKQGIDRIFNVFMKDSVYKDLENFVMKLKNYFLNYKGKIFSIREFLYHVGKNINDKNSFVAICARKKIPLFCPAISDCGFGQMVWTHLTQDKIITVDTFLDLREISELVWNAKRVGVFYIGGGVPKNFIQQATQFSEKHEKGASYGIQITTDRPEPGGSSGAPLKEGISWGKLKPKASHVTLYCDATIALPIIYASVKT